MADASFVRSSFLGGELSKFIQGRVDRPEYATGMNVCLNGFPIETGAWVRRPGFRFAQTTRGGQPGRLIKFDFQQVAAYNMEFADNHLRFFSGASLVTTNDSVTVTAISAANPAVVTLNTAVTWATGDQAFFSGLGVVMPLLQNRVFQITKVDTTHFSLQDGVTLANIDGSTLGAFSGTPKINRILDIVSPYSGGSWATLRSVQTDTTAFLLNGFFQPYAVQVTNQPNGPNFASFSLTPAVFTDGPYLDPFTNGVQAVPTAPSGVINIGLQFPTYVATQAYAIGAFVTFTAVNYISLVDANVGNQPDTHPSQWAPTDPSLAIGPNGFTSGDVGRLVRLFSEPDLWNVTTAYVIGNIVSYNPSGLPGQSTYWTAIAGNTGKHPGADTANWVLTPLGAAQWTWGKIVSIASLISAGAGVAIGDMTSNGGLAAAFDSVLVASQANCATALDAPNTPGFTSQHFVGKNYTGGAQKIQSATIYPSSDIGLCQAFATGGLSVPADAITVNLRAKQSAPANSADGTLLGSFAVSGGNFTLHLPTTIQSSDNTTAWNYVWFEIIAVYHTNIPGGLTSVRTCAAEVQFFSPPGTGTGTAISLEILGPPLLFTGGVSAVRNWRLGVYSNNTGWPTCGTYHDGRIWLSGAVPNRLDISVANGIKGGAIDFAPTDQYGNVLPSNGISAVFNAPDANPIFWLLPDLQGVICGTKAGEWLVVAPTSGPITATNISARRVTTIGCANIEPRRTEHTAVFVQKFGRKIMEFFPDVFSGKFTAPHITFTGKHLTQGGVQEIAYQQELNPVVWARVAGKLRGCTYKRDTLMTSQGPTIAGWHQHTLGSGRTIESIVVGPSSGGNLDALAMVTNDPLVGVRHVEIMTDLVDEGSSLTAATYLDDHVVPTSTTTSNVAPVPYGGLTLNGLWHLNGKTVTAWLGGLDCGDYVVANGSIVVPYGDGISAGTASGLFTAAFVTSFAGNMPMLVGFTYTSQGQIVRPNSREESGARQGPAFGKKRRSHQYAVQLEGSQGVSFGTTFAKIDPAIFRNPNDAVFPVSQQFSGIYWTSLTDDYSFDGMLCWQVTRPYIVNVLAIGGYIHTQDK